MKKGLLFVCVALTGLILTVTPLVLTDYAFKHWSDNGAALLWVYPPYAFFMHGSFWAGLALVLLSLSGIITRSKKPD